MTKEDKELLLKDLSARLPYNVVINCTEEDDEKTNFNCFLSPDMIKDIKSETAYWIAKPYLRPMSSMTEEEVEEYFSICTGSIRGDMIAKIDFYIKHHFDFRLTSEGLSMIEARLALEAPEGMYDLDNK